MSNSAPPAARSNLDSVARPLRKVSNLLALSFASYSEGDVDTAFDLFISGMEAQLTAGETAAVGSDDFSSLIEAALSGARSEGELLDAPREPAPPETLACLPDGDDLSDEFDPLVANLRCLSEV